MGKLGMVHLCQDLDGATWGWVIIFLFFVLFLCCCQLSFHDWYMINGQLLRLFHCSIFAFFVSGIIDQALLVHRNLCLFCKTISKVRFLIFTLWISLKKGECFDLNLSLGSLPYFYITIRLLGQVYHFYLLNCYPYSFGNFIDNTTVTNTMNIKNSNTINVNRHH